MGDELTSLSSQSQQEIWKLVPQRNIEVSNLGNIRDPKTKRPRKTYLSNGYPFTGDPYCGGAVAVHRLVMLAFVGPPPEGKEVDHVNGIRTDNRWPENLRYVSPSENINGSVARGHRGANRHNAILNEDLIRLIRTRFADGEPWCAIADGLGLKRPTVYHVVMFHNWRHVQ